jgi:hypothetical protein
LAKSSYKSAQQLSCARRWIFTPGGGWGAAKAMREQFGFDALCDMQEWPRAATGSFRLRWAYKVQHGHDARRYMTLSSVFAERAAREAAPELGNALFKIAKANAAAPLMPGTLDYNNQNHDMLAQFSISEAWIGDFSSGMIRLGEWSAVLHGLGVQECGLLSLMRCYDPKDRNHILTLFEQASTRSSSFCFSTTITLPNGFRQPLFCIGESNGLEEKFSGSMVGVFVFPRFKLETGSQIASRQ